MGVSNSIEKTVNEMPPEEEIKLGWKKQIRKEEKAGHESEFDYSDDISENSLNLQDESKPKDKIEIVNISDDNPPNNINKKTDTPNLIIKSNDNTDEPQTNDISNVVFSDFDYYFLSEGSSDSDDEQRKGRKNITKPLHDQFGTSQLISRVFENISESKNVIVIEQVDNTIHCLIDYVLSYENNGKFVFIIAEKKIGNLLEKHADQRITIVTSNSSLESTDEKVIVISAESAQNFNINTFDMIIIYDEDNQISNSIIKNNINFQGNYIIFTKIQNETILNQIKDQIQPCCLLYNDDDENSEKKQNEIDFNHCVGLKFDSLDELYSCIAYSAAKLGFKIIARDGTTGNKSPVRFNCERSSRKKDEKYLTTKKTHCSWELRASKQNFQWVIYKCNNVHTGHDLDPTMTSHLLLTIKQIQFIKTLKKNGSSNKAISRIFNDIYDENVTFTWRQIRSINKKKDSELFNLQTSELIHYIDNLGGIWFDKKGEINKNERVALLTFTKSDIINLQDYGDVIFIDGTNVPNKLSWQCYPITVVDKKLSLQCGGVLFTALATHDIFEWFISYLSQLMESDKINRHIKTMISDEDPSFMKAVNDFNVKNNNHIKNIICHWHKMKNLEKKLNELHLPPEIKENVKLLFNRIARCPKKEVVLLCIKEMKNVCKELAEYVENHIEPLLPQFSRAFIEDFTLGYNVSSLAESTNYLFKKDLTTQNYTLKEIRIEIIESFRNKNAIQRYKEYYSRKKPCVLKDTYGIKVSEKVKTLLLDSLLKSFRLISKNSNVYIDPNMPDEYYQVNYPICECQKLKYSGLPCSHIMRYSIENRINPMSLIDKRYLLDEEQPKLDWTPIMRDLSKITGICPKHIDDNSNWMNSLPFSDSENEDLKIQSLSHPVKNLKDNKTVMERYNLIMAEAKEVARHASNSEKKTQEVIHMLKNKWNDFNHDNNNSDNEITEAKGVKKGRPKLHPYKSKAKTKTTRKQSYCNVCSFIGLNNFHPQVHCKYASMLYEIAKKNSGDQKGNKCKICNGFGHRSTNCPNIKILKQKIKRLKEEEEEEDEDNTEYQSE